LFEVWKGKSIKGASIALVVVLVLVLEIERKQWRRWRWRERARFEGRAEFTPWLSGSGL